MRLPPELLEPLDNAASELEETSRPEAIRKIIRDWLVGHGYLKAE
ncbi:ribbon-helix-helix domain-containing protein [Mesorhizobium sp. M0174]